MLDQCKPSTEHQNLASIYAFDPIESKQNIEIGALRGLVPAVGYQPLKMSMLPLMYSALGF